MRADHPNQTQVSDPYYTRLKQQREKIIGNKPDAIQPVFQVKKPHALLTMTTHDYHQGTAPLQPFGKPPAGWMPKDKIMSIVRQIAEAKQMQQNAMTENAHI